MKYKFLFLLFGSISYGSYAQVNDAQFWEDVTIEKGITQKILFRVTQEGRVTENFTRPSFNYLDIGGTYKFNKHIHVTLAYVWNEKRQPTDFWSTRHQSYAAFTFRKKINSFLIKDRQMFMMQVKDYNTSTNGKFLDYYLRNKFSIIFIKYFKLEPYISEEIYYRTYAPNENTQYHFNRIRYFAGIFYHPNLINEFEAYYLIERQFNNNNAPDNNNYNNLNPSHNWVVGLGYQHTF